MGAAGGCVRQRAAVGVGSPLPLAPPVEFSAQSRNRHARRLAERALLSRQSQLNPYTRAAFSAITLCLSLSGTPTKCSSMLSWHRGQEVSVCG